MVLLSVAVSTGIIWLQCSCSNNDPRVIGRYYLDAVQVLHVCPRQLRSDRGSENCVTAAIQCCLTNNVNGRVFVASTANQRIESFGGWLRRLRMQWWMDLFEDMIFCGMLDTCNVNHVECIRYCFMDVIQDVCYFFVTVIVLGIQLELVVLVVYPISCISCHRTVHMIVVLLSLQPLLRLSVYTLHSLKSASVTISGNTSTISRTSMAWVCLQCGRMLFHCL